MQIYGGERALNTLKMLRALQRVRNPTTDVQPQSRHQQQAATAVRQLDPHQDGTFSLMGYYHFNPVACVMSTVFALIGIGLLVAFALIKKYSGPSSRTSLLRSCGTGLVVFGVVSHFIRLWGYRRYLETLRMEAAIAAMGPAVPPNHTVMLAPATTTLVHVGARPDPGAAGLGGFGSVPPGPATFYPPPAPGAVPGFGLPAQPFPGAGAPPPPMPVPMQPVEGVVYNPMAPPPLFADASAQPPYPAWGAGAARQPQLGYGSPTTSAFSPRA
jgi:hypothetical protein